MNILQRAHEILYERKEEKERMYGPMQEGMQEAAQLASIMTKTEITPDIIYACMIALKLSREAYNHKEDNILDAIVYMAAWNDYRSHKNQEDKIF